MTIGFGLNIENLNVLLIEQIVQWESDRCALVSRDFLFSYGGTDLD
jgi:hypothetical protein